MSKYNLKDIYEGMSDKEFNDAKESDRLEKHPERDTIKKIQALIAKEKSLEEDETSVNLAIEASQEKAGIKEDLEQAKKDAIEDVKDFADRHTSNMKIYMDALMKYGIGSEEVKKAKLATEKGLEDLGKELKEIAGYDRKGNKQEDTDGSDASKYKRAAMDVKEEKFSGEDEMQMHLKQYRDGNIDGDDLFNAFDEIINGSVSPPSERGFNTQYGMEEAKAIPTEPGITKIGDDGKEYGVRASNHDRKMAMRSVIDILRDELGVNTDGAIGYIRTHKDDLFDGTVDAYNKDEVVADFKEYDSVNRDSVDEMQSLKEYFNRFM